MSDIAKMDPMARKLRTTVDAFQKAIDDGDPNTARNTLMEIQKFADYLSTDLEALVQKADKPLGVNDMFAGGTPVWQFKQETYTTGVDRENQLPGTIMSARHGPRMHKGVRTMWRGA